MNLLEICTITDDDIPLMEYWLNKSYIKKWYHDSDEWIEEIKQRYDKYKFVKHFIVLHNGRQIGFCQYYPCSDAQEEWYGDISLTGTYSIDYFVGEEEFLGKGYGKAIVGLLARTVFSLVDAQRIIVLPEKENTPSIRSLLSNGFSFDDNNRLYLKTK